MKCRSADEVQFSEFESEIMVAVTQTSSDSSCAAPFYVVAWAREMVGAVCGRQECGWVRGVIGEARLGSWTCGIWTMKSQHHMQDLSILNIHCKLLWFQAIYYADINNLISAERLPRAK